MERHQNNSLGRQWGRGFFSCVLLLGTAFTAVSVIPPNVDEGPVGTTTTSKGNVEAGDRIFPPARTSGIILSYSFQPWGGAVSHHSKEPPCPRNLDRNPAIRACGGLIRPVEPADIRLKYSPIQRNEGSPLSRRRALRLEHAEVTIPFHRT